MAKKDYFLGIDTETTQDGKVADFGAVITDRKGKIYSQCAILVKDIYTNKEEHPLFHMFGDSGDMWSKAALPKRYAKYDAMVESGARMIASVSAINRWLDRAKAEYNPYLYAYNLNFDLGKCENTAIDLTMFADRQFCLWYAAVSKWAFTKKYKEFALMVNAINPPTKPSKEFPHGNCSYKTNAETMTRFVTNQPFLENEPHTAIEDLLYYELPILNKLVQTTKKDKWINPPAFNWRDVQLRDHFIA